MIPIIVNTAETSPADTPKTAAIISNLIVSTVSETTNIALSIETKNVAAVSINNPIVWKNAFIMI